MEKLDRNIEFAIHQHVLNLVKHYKTYANAFISPTDKNGYSWFGNKHVITRLNNVAYTKLQFVDYRTPKERQQTKHKSVLDLFDEKTCYKINEQNKTRFVTFRSCSMDASLTYDVNSLLSHINYRKPSICYLDTNTGTFSLKPNDYTVALDAYALKQCLLLANALSDFDLTLSTNPFGNHFDSFKKQPIILSGDNVAFALPPIIN